MSEGSNRPGPASWRRRAARLAVNLLAALGLVMAVVTLTPVTKWWLRALAGPLGRPRGDVLIVLGGDRYDTRTLGVASYWRCIYAAEAYREGCYRRIVVSGGGPTEVPIAATLAECLLYRGVPKEAIWLETASQSTRENALGVQRLLGESPGRLVLLTSDIHMFRARRAFARVGLELAPWPAVDTGRMVLHWRSRWPAFTALCEETAKIIYYFARGWI